MKIAIIGAAGFLGTNIALNILRDPEYAVADLQLNLVDEKEEYFDCDEVNQDQRIKKFIKRLDGNCDYSDVVEDADVVFHLVSTTNPTSSNYNISNEIVGNISISVSLLESCVKYNVNKVVFISSGGTVYGNQKCPIKEMSETMPINTYGIQKLTIEKLLYLYNYLHGIDYRIARLSNPYGPYQRPNGRLGAVTTFLYRALKKERIEIYGDGSVVRDYIYIDDAMEALKNVSFKDTRYKLYNIGSGIGVSLNEVLQEIRDLTGEDLNISYSNSRSVDLKTNYLDVSRYIEEFGNISNIELKEGLKRTALYLKNNL